MIIRKIQEDEARAYLTMLIQLDNETDTMMFEPGERTSTVAEMRKKIESAHQTGSLILVAEVEGNLVGFFSSRKRVCSENSA